MENKSPKRKRQKYENSDRISQLPEPVLHHILCFLSPKKALQTCLLSKSWRHLGPTRPVIDLRRTCGTCCRHHQEIKFCECCFAGKKEAFVSFLGNTLHRYHHQNIFPQEVRLEKLEFEPQSISLLEKWIPVFVKPNTRVTRFHLSFHTCPEFDLPAVVFQAESLREMYLHGCSLSRIQSIALKNLQKLSLCYVGIHDETLEKIMAGCHLLEYVGLHHCEGLKAIKIANENHYLKHFEFSCFCGVNNSEHSIEIDAPTLQSISISSCSNWIHNHNNYFPHLKSLHLYCVQLYAESFHNFSGNFPCLQELMLIHCRGFEEINLSSCSIKRLTIKLIYSVKKVAVDAPNLLYFEFYSSYLPTTFSLAATSRECESHLALSDLAYTEYDALSTLLGLIEMVKRSSQSQISLKLYENLCFKISQTEWSLNEHPIAVEHLGLNIGKNCPVSLPHLLNALFRIFRPRYISALHWEKVKEFLWKTLIRAREKREYDWEQPLEEVSIEASDEKGEVWHDVQWTSLPEWSKNQKSRFRLKWRD